MCRCIDDHMNLLSDSHRIITFITMSTHYKFQGWAGHDADACNGKLKFEEFEPKKWDEHDVDGESHPNKPYLHAIS
jgi:hypothetical protein